MIRFAVIVIGCINFSFAIYAYEAIRRLRTIGSTPVSRIPSVSTQVLFSGEAADPSIASIDPGVMETSDRPRYPIIDNADPQHWSP